MNERATPEQVQATIDSILAPLREQRQILEAERDRIKQDLTAVTAMLTRVNRLLAANEPKTKPGPKPAAAKGHGPVSQEKLEQLILWLRAHVDGDEFHSSGIVRRDDFNLMSQATLSNALNALRDQGIVRLDHTGNGGAKFYKLVDVR